MIPVEARYEVLWPSSPMGVRPRRSAARVDDLGRARVAFLWDNVFRGDELFPLLADTLRRHHPWITVIPYDVFGNTHGGDEIAMVDALPRSLRDRGVDAVVSGMGC